MPSPSTLVLANHLIADAERHWLYGHPYRELPGPSPYARPAPPPPGPPRRRRARPSRRPAALRSPRPRRLSGP